MPNGKYLISKALTKSTLENPIRMSQDPIRLKERVMRVEDLIIGEWMEFDSEAGVVRCAVQSALNIDTTAKGSRAFPVVGARSERTWIQ